MRFPPVSNFAPALMLASTCFSMSLTICGVASGPMSVDFVERIADLQRLHGGDELLLEIVGDLLVDDEALRGDAGLAVVHDARLHGGRHGVVEIGGRHDDERIAAAELEHGLLDVLPGVRGDARAGRLAAGQRRRLHALVVEDASEPGPT